MNRKINALSLFSGGGIAEIYFEEIGIHVAVANELLPERAEFYKYTHPQTTMICGNIANKEIYNDVISISKKENIKFILATPPCQGMSTLGPQKIYNR